MGEQLGLIRPSGRRVPRGIAVLLAAAVSAGLWLSLLQILRLNLLR